jgi:hypothetical protein
MSWIRKTIFLVTLFLIASYGVQPNQDAVLEFVSLTEKPESNYSKDYARTSDFIQPQSAWHFTANLKNTPFTLGKWFDCVFTTFPTDQLTTISCNFASQFSLQSDRVALMLYPFHHFW